MSTIAVTGYDEPDALPTLSRREGVSVKKRSIFFWVVPIVLIWASMLTGGCTSTGSGRGAYPTLKQIQMIVDRPMTRYRNAASAGAVTAGERQRVDEAYNNFLKAFDAAVKAANNNYEVTTPDNVKVLANQVIDAIAAIPF